MNLERYMEVEIVKATRYKQEFKNGLITILWTIPYYIHVENMTHKRFARNASSARAQKSDKHIAMGYYVPQVFYKQGNGMKSSKMPIENQERAKLLYHSIWAESERIANELSKLGVSKEQSNRVLPTFKHIKVITTGTEDAWKKWLNLRYNENADVAMQLLAEQVNDLIENVSWSYSDKHIPMGNENDNWIEVSARIARISYSNPKSGKNDFDLGNELIKNKHLSPTEHIAQWEYNPLRSAISSKMEDLHENYGWTNYRSMIERDLNN